MDETGLKGFEAITLFGLIAPARTPPEVVAALRASMAGVGAGLIGLVVAVVPALLLRLFTRDPGALAHGACISPSSGRCTSCLG